MCSGSGILAGLASHRNSPQPRPSVAGPTGSDDAQREYAYNKHTDKVMPLAKQERWTVVDMKNDWKTIFSKR